MIKKRQKNLILILLLFCFIGFLSIIPIFSDNIANSNLKTSTDNYLFNGVEYDIELNDVYDDENNTKIYTGANFQSSSFNTSTYDWNGLESEEVSPVNNTNYKSPDLGDYPGTYTFDDQPVGTTGTDIYAVHSIGTGYSPEIIEEYDDHDKVMEVNTVYSISGQKIEFNRTHFGLTTSNVGVVEFWFEITAGPALYFRLKHSPGIVQIVMYPTYAKITTGAGDTSYYYTTNGLRHYKIDYDCPNNLVSVWIEEALVIDNEATILDVSATYLDRWYFEHTGSSTFYMDAIGSSLYPEYTPSEHHAGTYSFTNDANGANPAGWSIQEGATYTLQTIGSLGDHKKVIEMYDNETTNRVRMSRSVPAQTILDIEFYYRSNDITKTLDFLVADGTYNNFYMHTLPGLTVDTWHLIRYSINTITDKFCSWIDGNADDVDVALTRNMDAIITILWETSTAQSDYYVYLDAIGGLWDPYYTIGDNLLPSTGNLIPISLNMIDGTFDNTDNMKANDGSNSEFTSEGEGSPGDQFLDDVAYTAGAYYSGSIANTHTDDGNKLMGKSSFGGTMIMDLLFDPAPSGGDYIISLDSLGSSDSAGFSSHTHDLLINDVLVETANNIDFDDVTYYGVNTIKLRIPGQSGTYKYLHLYYIKIALIVDGPPPELNFTVDLNFSEVDTSKLLALDVSSHHYTNVSTTIIGNIYDYDSSSYTEMFSSSNTAETENYFMDNTSISDYLDGSGNLRLQFTGTNVADFKLLIDYIKVRFYYKMDLTHTISFDTNGYWKYRWELIGSLHYTDWTFFEVVDPVPNFDAISESEVLSRWILQGADINPIEDFHDDINTDYWNLVDVSDIDFNYQEISSKDSHVRKYYPNNNYGNELYISVVASSTYERYTYLYFTNLDSNYLFLNQTGTNKIGLYKYDSDAGDLEIHNTTSFDEYAITWNNAPVGIDMLDSISNSGTGWKYWTVPYLNEYYMIKFSAESDLVQGNFRSREYGSLKPTFIRYNVSKNYFGSGYMYIQTNTTELLSLKSQDYVSHYTLNSGDYFEVDFETNSDSQINLILLKDGEVQKSLVLSQSGNTNFNRHTTQISVSEDLEFDQLKISSTFEDTDNVKVYDIKTYKYTITGDYKDFYVSPNSLRSVYLSPDTYNLRIFEGDDKKFDGNLTIPNPDNYFIYTPLPNRQCRLALFSPDDIYLPLTDYHIDVNRSLNGEYAPFPLLDDVFNVDMETYIYIDVYDRHNTLIDSFKEWSSDYIELTLSVYQLQIKNLMEQQTTIDINGSYEYPLLSGNTIEFMLAESYYEIGYYDMDGDPHSFNIYLGSNQAYELNRSKICFLSYADQQGNHLPFDNYKTYINGSMIYQQIFYEDAGDDVNITITDRYDYEVYQDVYSVVSGDNFIPITLTMYSLKVMNQQEVFNHINISRDPNYYESEYYWSEWIAPNEIIEFRLFAGHYKINLTDSENDGSSYYSYTLNGDDILLISSGNTISNLIINIANVNTTIGNQITNVVIDLTNQNSNINNTIINIEINLSNVNSTLGTLLTNINLDIININNNISNLYTFTENNFLNLGNNINNSFTLIENNIIAINQTISTLVIGLDGKITVVNATINTMFTEMNSQFIVTQSTLDFSFTFLNQTITQIGNNITENHIALNNLIIQRANEIDNSLIQISTLVNLINSSVVNESLVIQSLVNIIGNNITENHVIINDLINLIGNNITENNINMVSLIELVGNNITTNHFVIQTLIDYVSNNITDNHLEFLTNINLINNTIGQNQIELINRLLFINNSINTMALDLTNQILLVNNTIYSAILDVSTSIDFNSDNILGNISLTYQQNDFLTELYKETMFSQLLNWSDVAYNYSLMEDRIDVWEFINNYKNQSIEVHLRYQDIIDNLTITAQNSILQYLPKYSTDYNLWSVKDQKYLDEWKPLPENRTVPFGFYEADIPTDPAPIINTFVTYLIVILFFVGLSFGALKLYYSTKERKNEIPPELVNLTSKPNKKKIKGVVDNRL